MHFFVCIFMCGGGGVLIIILSQNIIINLIG